MAIKVVRKTPLIEKLQRNVEASRLKLERQLIESQLELLDRIVDRRSAYLDETEGQYWTPIGVTFDRDSPVPFFDEESHAYIRRKSRWAAMHSPYAISFLTNLRSFVIGKGHKHTVVIKDRFGDRTEELEQYRSLMERFVRNLLRRNKWMRRQKDMYWRYHRDGEVFIRLFPQSDGYTLFRFMHPECVKTPSKWMQDESASYGIKTDPEDVESPEWYFYEDDTIEYYEVQHRKANVDLDIKRGLSSLYAIGENIDRARDLLRNMSVVAAQQAAIAMIRRHKNTTSTAIQSFVNNTTSYRSSNPTTGETRNYKKIRPGTVIDTKDNVDYEFPSIGLNPAAPTAVLGAELRATASAKTLPEYMVGSDASNANYSSTMVAESPAVRLFQSEQEEVVEADHELLWAAIDYAIQAGKLPPEVRTYCDIETEAPVVVTRKELEIAQADDIYLRNRTVSPQIVAARQGHDPKKVQRDWSAFDDANPDLQQLPLPSEM